MPNPSVCFFTVCGGGEEYEFLLGGIEHHSRMGFHVVLDTSLEPRTFKNLPETVRWIHEPIYGAGYGNFKFRSSVDRAMNLAKETKAEVLVYLDCDEFFSLECVDHVFPAARDHMIEVKTVHWTKDGRAWDLGESEWHRRLWPSKMEVEISRNEAWISSPFYDGNPENHPVPRPLNGSIVRVGGFFHHHLHYALGRKSEGVQRTELMTSGKESPVPSVPWPEPLSLWRDSGIAPSSRLV